MIADLLPASTDLAELGAIWAAGLVLMLWGRALCLGRLTPELQTLAGWGGLCIVLTVWAVATPARLQWPAAAIVAVAGMALVVRRLRPGRDDWIALGRVTLLALPLWAVMLTARPSQPDTFLNLLPNAAYLYDHGVLPVEGGPPSHSFLPAAPYNLQFWAYLAGLPLPELPAAAMAHINVLLHLLFGLLLARLIQFDDGAASTAPGWGALALGLLLATALNPGFVPRIYFASYSEAAVAVTLGAAGWLLARTLTATAEDWRPPMERQALALVLAALVNIKQESVAFVAALAVTAVVLSLVDRDVRFSRGLRLCAPVFLPAAALYGLWRWFAMTHFEGGELALLPVAQWHTDMLPTILARIGGIVGEKGIFFGFLALAALVLILRLAMRGFDQSTRLLAVLVGCFLAYNGFLLFTYVAHFTAAMSADAHSYFRYNTHLSLLLVIALASAARDELARLRQPARAARQVGAALAVLSMLAVPICFAKRLRFDLEMPQPLVWALGHDVARLVGPDDRLALVLPGDNGSVAAMLESVLRFTPPRRLGLDLSAVSSLDEGTLSTLAAKGYDKALVSCTDDRPGGWPARSAVYLEHRDGLWRQVVAWRYPDLDRARWSAVLSAAPLCR